MRFGTPMYQRAPDKKRVFVTIEPPNEPHRIRLWEGWSVKQIRRAAQLAYPDCYLQFGRWF